MSAIVGVTPILLRTNAVLDVHRQDGAGDAFLIALVDDEGNTGYGEADTLPLAAWASTVSRPSHSICVGLAELTVGADADDPETLHRRLEAGAEYHARGGAGRHALSAIDMAAHDLAARRAGVSLAERLAGTTPDDVAPVYASLVMPETERALEELCEATLDEGYTAVKFGWGPLGHDVDADVTMLRRARACLGPDVALMVDAGCRYDVAAAIKLAQALDGIGAAWFEEPVAAADLEALRRVCALSPVPIAAGERVEQEDDFLRLVDAGVGVLQPDLSRCGGITVAARVARMAAESGRRCVSHQYSSALLTAAAIHWSVACTEQPLVEYPLIDSPLARELLTEPLTPAGGVVAVPAGPGLGVTLDAAVVQALGREPYELADLRTASTHPLTNGIRTQKEAGRGQA